VPVIEISSATPANGVHLNTVVRELNVAVAEALPCRLGAVVSTWRVMTGGYAVGAAVSDTVRTDSHGPIVHAYLADGEGDPRILRGTVARVLTDTLGLAAGNVIVIVHRVGELVAQPIGRTRTEPRRKPRGRAAALHRATEEAPTAAA